MVSEKDKAQITMMYRQAADKRSQIKILSELYLISRAEVCKVLFDAGYTDKHIKRMLEPADTGKESRCRPWTAEEEDRLCALRARGRSYGECAVALKRSANSVASKAYQLGC
ncbi:MAG: hypothetical protein E7575_06140 [Ruminococcaceae bacterium]|nr:hypothetical protein [Oscillospiraceae bacterium]